MDKSGIPCPTIIFPARNAKVPARLFQPALQLRGAGKQSQRAEFAEACRASAVAMFARSDDGHEGNARIARSERVVNVVAQIERRGGISLSENFLQTFRVRLPLGVLPGDDRSEMFCCRPAF